MRVLEGGIKAGICCVWELSVSRRQRERGSRTQGKCFIQRQRLLQAHGFIWFHTHWQELLLYWFVVSWCLLPCEEIKKIQFSAGELYLNPVRMLFFMAVLHIWGIKNQYLLRQRLVCIRLASLIKMICTQHPRNTAGKFPHITLTFDRTVWFTWILKFCPAWQAYHYSRARGNMFKRTAPSSKCFRLLPCCGLIMPLRRLKSCLNTNAQAPFLHFSLLLRAWSRDLSSLSLSLTNSKPSAVYVNRPKYLIYASTCSRGLRFVWRPALH